jgi:DNA-binding transcriptional MerR regulator
MRIGELAEESGLTAPTVRFYERQGLLPRPPRSENGYREYDATDLERARMFARLRELGLEPGDAARLADHCATGHCDRTWSELQPLLDRQRELVASRIAELSDLDARLASLQAILTTGRSVDPTPIQLEEHGMTHCDCDDTCCGGPTVPCC